MSSDLLILSNTPSTITLGGKIYKTSTPSLADLAEAENYGKELKQIKRKEYIKQYSELFSQLPKEMPIEEKRQVINNILPSELTPKDKIELLAAMPETWDEEKRNRQLMRVVIDREGVEWMETLYILWLCIKKNQPEVTFDMIKSLVVANDLDMILKVIAPKKVGNDEKNV